MSILEDQDIEITTFRGERKTIESDLEKRDFTIDALAYSPSAGLVDPLEGKEDIASHILRCCYLPKEDFQEDPLRILRGIRIAGKYHLQIEEKTSSAMHRYASSQADFHRKKPRRIPSDSGIERCGSLDKGIPDVLKSFFRNCEDLAVSSKTRIMNSMYWNTRYMF